MRKLIRSKPISPREIQLQRSRDMERRLTEELGGNETPIATVLQLISRPVSLLWSPRRDRRYSNWRILAGECREVIQLGERRGRRAGTATYVEVFIRGESMGVFSMSEYMEYRLSLSTGDYHTHTTRPITLGRSSEIDEYLAELVNLSK